MASFDSEAGQPISRRLAGFARRQALRPRVLVSRWRLDQDLAAGVDSGSRPSLGLRADQLLRPRSRRRLANSLKRIVDDFDADRGWWLTAAVPFVRDQVAEARDTLLWLAEALLTAEEIHPRGVALATRLLTDPDSPLYVRSARGALQRQAQTALDQLVGRPNATPEAWEPWSSWASGVSDDGR